MNNNKEELLKKFSSHRARVAVLGLGYVGLPLATLFADAGFSVIGIDTDPQKIRTLLAGRSYIQDVPTDLIAHQISSGKFTATTDFSALADVDAVSICVPTPLRKTGDPDLSYILDATDKLKDYVHPGMIIVLESTTYPGTTREILVPELTSVEGLTIGENIYIAFSPERVDPGREDWTTINTPKVIGGITKSCTEVASTWYGQAIEEIVPVSSVEVAEMAKLLENTFRMINIGLVNEMAIMCRKLGIDVWEVIEAAATKPFGFMKFSPGPGLGGHCIPIDPLYLTWKLRSLNYNTRFINLASEINTYMPRYVVEIVQNNLNKNTKPLNGSRVLLLGVAYKPDIDDIRESPALDIIGLLREKGADVIYHDPYLPHIQHDDWYLESVQDLIKDVQIADCVVIIANHSSYNYSAILDAANLIVDTRNSFGELGFSNSKVVRL